MKIKVNKREFYSFIKTFQSIGKTKIISGGGENVNFANIISDGDVLFFSGRNKSSKIMVRGNLEAEVLEEGSFHITDLKKFMAELKPFKGKNLTIDFKDNVSVTDGKKSKTFPFVITPEDSLSLNKVNIWNESILNSGSEVTLSYKGTEVVYDPWFEISEKESISELNTISSDLFDDVKVNTCNFSVEGDELKISYQNLIDKKKGGLVLPIAGFKDMSLELGELFPVLNSISQSATFYHRKTTKGTDKIYIISNGMDWEISYFGGK